MGILMTLSTTPRPRIYESILVLGGGTPATSGATFAKVGGFWGNPNLGLSYLLAARHTLEAGEREGCVNEVALPIAYLQRHAMELALKDVIDKAQILKRDEEWLAALKKDPEAPLPERAEVPLRHGFDVLFKALREELAAIGFHDVPTRVRDIVERLRDAEGAEPARWRYERLWNGEPSLPNPIELRVGEMQLELEHVFEEVFHYQGFGQENENLATSLAHEGMALDQAIAQIVPFDRL